MVPKCQAKVFGHNCPTSVVGYPQPPSGSEIMPKKQGADTRNISLRCGSGGTQKLWFGTRDSGGVCPITLGRLCTPTTPVRLVGNWERSEKWDLGRYKLGRTTVSRMCFVDRVFFSCIWWY